MLACFSFFGKMITLCYFFITEPCRYLRSIFFRDALAGEISKKLLQAVLLNVLKLVIFAGTTKLY